MSAIANAAMRGAEQPADLDAAVARSVITLTTGEHVGVRETRQYVMNKLAQAVDVSTDVVEVTLVEPVGARMTIWAHAVVAVTER